MGYSSAVTMAKELPLEQALHWHLTVNHFPPVPPSMVPVCIAAIEAYAEEDYAQLINLPIGVSWRGKNKAPASEIVENCHLDAWVVCEYE